MSTKIPPSSFCLDQLLMDMGPSEVWLIYSVSHHWRILIFLLPMGYQWLIISLLGIGPLLLLVRGPCLDWPLCRACACCHSLWVHMRISPVVSRWHWLLGSYFWIFLPFCLLFFIALYISPWRERFHETIPFRTTCFKVAHSLRGLVVTLCVNTHWL